MGLVRDLRLGAYAARVIRDTIEYMTGTERVLRVHSLLEAAYYIVVTPCAECGSGPLEAHAGQLDRTTHPGLLIMPTTCRACGVWCAFRFNADHVCSDEGWPTDPLGTACEPAGDAPSGPINTSEAPSEVIDVAGWLLLYTLLQERVSSLGEGALRVAERSVRRRLQVQAAACLAEALKFYDPDNDLPPEEAFFTAESRRQFRARPELFARDRIIGLRAKLPWSRGGQPAEQ